MTTPGLTPILDFDPNLTLCGRMIEQCVRLTFGQWRFRATMEVTVRGNLTGLPLVTAAVNRAYEMLLGDHDYAALILRNDENTMECSDDDNEGEDWLAGMLVSAEIVAISPIQAEHGQ